MQRLKEKVTLGDKFAPEKIITFFIGPEKKSFLRPSERIKQKPVAAAKRQKPLFLASSDIIYECQGGRTIRGLQAITLSGAINHEKYYNV